MTVVDLSEEGVVRYLKIDGTLTQQITQKPSVQRLFGIIQTMASGLKLCTVAEFIENETALALLRKQKIDLGQGYFLGQPQDIAGWLVKKQFGDG